jgi:uncharacterized RmlC-like cupin family protein
MSGARVDRKSRFEAVRKAFDPTRTSSAPVPLIEFSERPVLIFGVPLGYQFVFLEISNVEIRDRCCPTDQTRANLRWGASTETVGAKKVCLNVLPVPPGAKAKVHYHKGIETIAYLLEGECSVYYGDKLEHQLTVQAGDQVYLPEDVPHAPYNQGKAPCKWLVVHSSGSDQDGIVLLPELDLILASK